MSPKEHLHSMREIIDDNAGGNRDDNLRRTIFDHVRALQELAHGGDFGEKLGEVMDNADIYFSDQKHHREDGGLPQVRLRIRLALAKIESFLPDEDTDQKPASHQG
jgi:hypothetical protein